MYQQVNGLSVAWTGKAAGCVGKMGRLGWLLGRCAHGLVLNPLRFRRGNTIQQEDLEEENSMRRIFRVAKSALVLSLVFMMTMDTANACRLFHWMFAHRAACTSSCASEMGVQMMPMVETLPMNAGPVVESYPVDSECCCEAGVPVDAGYVESYESTDGYVDFPTEVYMEGTPVHGSEVIMDASPVDLAPMDTIVAPTPVADDFVPVPTPAEPDVVEAAEAEPTEAAPADEESSIENPLEQPADDATAPMDDDVFDAAPADDAFDAAPEADAAPADDAFSAPADDTFSTPDDGGFAEPAADDEPAAAADDGDDLFSDTPADDVMPADDGGDDLFNSPPADDGMPADGDDLFNGDDTADDDLFSGGADDAVPSVEESAPADELDDLFSQNQRTDGMRVWIDDTGSYQTVGRLVVISKTHVRLLKENGRYSTVPLTRLSEGDLDYVMMVAMKLTGSQRIASR